MQTTFSSTKRSSSISIDFIVPQGWHELGDKQLRYVYQLLAENFSADEIKTLCLLQWSGTKVIGRQDSGAYLLRKGKTPFEATLSWILSALCKAADGKSISNCARSS